MFLSARIVPTLFLITVAALEIGCATILDPHPAADPDNDDFATRRAKSAQVTSDPDPASLSQWSWGAAPSATAPAPIDPPPSPVALRPKR